MKSKASHVNRDSCIATHTNNLLMFKSVFAIDKIDGRGLINIAHCERMPKKTNMMHPKDRALQFKR